MEQMEKVIELIRESPEKSVGLKLTNMVDIPVEDQKKNVTETDSKSIVKFEFFYFIFLGLNTTYTK